LSAGAVAQSIAELIGGRMDAVLTSEATARPHIESGRLRVLAVASEVRSAL
jgi:tripartite-type tricarboxylate transporter receptor subunit TctC